MTVVDCFMLIIVCPVAGWFVVTLVPKRPMTRANPKRKR